VREYILLISGTFNPPHCAHIKMGIRAAENVKRAGHAIKNVIFAPVHDHYLCNKAVAAGTSFCCPMETRIEILRALIAAEAGAEGLNVVDFESNRPDLLEATSSYWRSKLPDGYLRTIGTCTLLENFSKEFCPPGGRTRLGLVCGIDNLAGMTSWNSPAQLFARADLFLFGRGQATMEFTKDPTELLSPFAHFEVQYQLPVEYCGKPLFGTMLGQFDNASAVGTSSLFLLPPLAALEGCSSTSVRAEVARALSEGGDSGKDSIATRISSTTVSTSTTTSSTTTLSGQTSGLGCPGVGSVPLSAISRALSKSAVLVRHGYTADNPRVLDSLAALVASADHPVQAIRARGTAQGSLVVPP
jgi:nicotinic acid mononucleotide adenylyltransferase